MRRRSLSLCTVTVAFTMTERVEHLHHDNAPDCFSALVQAFLVDHHIIQSVIPPTAQICLSVTSGLSQSKKSPFNGRRFVNAAVTQYTSLVDGVSLTTNWPHGSVTVDECTVKDTSDWLPSYIKATLPVREIFRMAGYFPDVPRCSLSCAWSRRL